MNGCIYRTKDGECDLYAEGGKFHAFCCNMNSCEGRKMSNADRLRAMTDEELAEFLIQDGDCPPERMYTDSCPNCDRVTSYVCYDCWLDWLRQEAEECQKT